MTQGIYDPGRLTIPHYTSPSAGGAQGAGPGVGNLLGHRERSLGRPRPILEAGTRTPSPSPCLQVTFQARDIDESRHLYDHLAVLSP